MTDNSEAAKQGAIVLPEELTIAQSNEYCQLLGERLEEIGDIELDAHAVTRVDTACIQLFAVAQQVLEDAGHTLRWRGVSEAFRESVALLGMTRELVIPEKA